MTTTYEIVAFHADRADWADHLAAAIAGELRSIGLHESVTVEQVRSPSIPARPAVGVFLGSEAGAQDTDLIERVAAAAKNGLVVIPLVEDLAHYVDHTPPPLHPVNGRRWNDHDVPALARLLLEELGIEDRSRRVFISHKRDDGLGVAEQLHDALTKAGFLPFIDRFAIPAGSDVQSAIADALEEYAFLLLVETPLAHTSRYVFWEVDYALSHTMGTLILRWPDNPTPVPGSVGVNRLDVAPDDLTADEHGYDVLTDSAIERIIREVESAHAAGIGRRRRMLVQSIEDAVTDSGTATCVPLPGWRLLVSEQDDDTLVGVAPRLPTSRDLYELDCDRRQLSPKPHSGLLVHASRRIESSRQAELKWAIANRQLALAAETEVGARWRD